METYIALLRGINVSGQKKIPMAELRELLNRLEFKNVQTYIQSGNVVFQLKKTDNNVLSKKISEAIQKHFDFLVPVLVITHAELKSIFNNCPFPQEKKEKSYFTLLTNEPNKDVISALHDLNYPEEEIILTNKCVYFFSEKSYGKVKYNNNLIERKLKVAATSRNYNTMKKLLELSV